MLFEGLENRLALAIDGLAVSGDSWSDEYAAETYNFGRNWAEILVSERGLDLGAPGDYSADERGANGTAFNWAQAGSTTIEMLFQNQDIMISQQFTAGDVSHVVLMGGMTDMAPGGEKFTKIGDGTWVQAQIDSEMAFMAANLESLMAVMSTVPIKGLVATIPDPTMTPQGKTLFDDAARLKIRTAVESVNIKIRENAAKFHMPVIDLAGLSTAILGSAGSPAASRTIGGNVYSTGAGIPKTNLFIDGGILPHTVFQAHIANLVIEGLNFAYGENIAKLTEAQIVALGGQTYGGTDTFPVNYRNLVTVPPVTVFLDYGSTGTPVDDFTARISEWATARGIAQLTPDVGGVPGELSQVKTAILSKLQTTYTGTTVNFVTEKPGDTRFEAIKLGRLSSSVPGDLTSKLGQSTFDWLNASETSTGFVFVDLITFNANPNLGFDNINLSTLSRADQLRYVQNALSFYLANEIGRGMGLQAADAYGYSSITTDNAANTAGVQLLDFMSGDTSLGFNTSVFNGNPTFTYSPLAKAKLQFGHWLTNPSLVTAAETGSAHGTTGTAQALALVSSSTASQRVGIVKGASIGVGSQIDLYKISAAAVGDKITAQTLASGVYGAPIDTVIRILAADGTTVLATNDDTLLGNNSIGQVGTTNVDSDSLVMNYVVATAGDIFIEVTAKASGTGNYDLVVTNTVINNFPWHNAGNPLNVTGNITGVLVTAFDAIAVINELNNPVIMNPATFQLPVPSGSVAPPPFLDVTPNGQVTAFDAIPVINYLNLNPLGGPGFEFVPFEESAPEATEPEATEPTATAAAPATEPVRSQRSANVSSSHSGNLATALPYQASSQTSLVLSSASFARGTASYASNPLTWLLLAPVSAAGEETEESGCESSAEHSQALAQLFGEEE